MIKKKIILFEPEVIGGMGHHLDSLIESSIFFKKHNEIIWFVNNKFTSNNLFIPKFVKNYKIIDTYKSKKNYAEKIKKFINSIINFCAYINYGYKNKILKKIFFAFFMNYLSFPEYFFSFYLTYKKLNLTNDDIIIAQSCRPKDIELLYFLTLIERVYPTIIARVIYPPKKKKLKNFYFYLKNIVQNNNLKKKFHFFTEVESVRKIIQKNTILKTFNFTHIFSFYKRKDPQFINIGFLGASRKDKGFDKIPELIEKLKIINPKTKFTIQISNSKCHEIAKTKNAIMNLSKKFSDIKIYNGYIDYFKYRKLLKTINIMPILHDPGQVNTVGSGLFFSCITHEIPMIIPKKSSQLQKQLIPGCFRTAVSVDDYVKEINHISKNYKYHLLKAKKLSLDYKNKIKKCKLIELINKNYKYNFK